MPKPDQLITAGNKTLETPIGPLNFELGYPTPPTSQKLYDVMDFQRATQLYLWALPLVSFANWKYSQEKYLDAKNYDLVKYMTFRQRLSILTANATTPYVGGFFDLKETGPMVMHFPAGLSAGGFTDMWQRQIIDAGLTGPDKGKGGKYLLLGPGQEVENTDGYYVARSRTFNFFYGLRSLAKTEEEQQALYENFLLQPYVDEVAGKEPRKMNYVTADKTWDGFQPRGIEYWQVLNDILNEENREEKDAYAYSMLASLGIGIGKRFEPDERLTGILNDATLTGEAMARALDYDPRDERRKYYPDKKWELAISFDIAQIVDNRLLVDERATWFYEAVTATNGMVSKTPGEGQAYLAAQRDAMGEWLDGSQTYRLRVPAEVPAAQFWSATAYSNDTRCLIDTQNDKSDAASVDPELVYNDDGSADIWFSPAQPQGVSRANWVPTRENEGFFVYFRFYAPLAPYFDKSWQLPDIEKV